MPRSKILALLAHARAGPDAPTTPQTNDIESILGSIKSLDDLKPALAKLEPLRNRSSEAQTAFQNVDSMEQNYEAIEAGLPTNLNSGYGDNVVPSAVRVQLLLFALQHCFTTYKGAPPAADEKPEAYVSRVLTDATSRGDWRLLQRALAAHAYLNRNSTVGQIVPTNTSADTLLAALNQEDARQFALAVVSYQDALKTGDPGVPGKLIGDRLEAIRRDHPKEYEEGMHLLENPPMPRYYPEMPYRPGLPVLPGAPPSGLAIPATTTPTAAKPASTSNAAPTPAPQPAH